MKCLGYNPSISHRILSSSPAERYLKELRDKEEIAGLSYRLGITIEYPISKRFSIQSGLLYGDRSFRTKQKELIWGGTRQEAAQASFLSFHYYYADIPLKIKYEFLQKKKWNYFISGGITTSLFFQYNRNKHQLTSNGWTISKDQQNFFGYEFVNFFAELEPGITYEVNPHFKLRASITLQIPLRATNPYLDMKEHLFSAGLGLGVVYRPGK